jgi:hypothetical protein
VNGGSWRLPRAALVAVGVSGLLPPVPEADASTVGPAAGAYVMSLGIAPSADSGPDVVPVIPAFQAVSSSELAPSPDVRDDFIFRILVGDIAVLQEVEKIFAEIPIYEEPNFDPIEMFFARGGVASARQSVVSALALQDSSKLLRWAVLTRIPDHVETLGLDLALEVLVRAIDRGGAGDRSAAAEALGQLGSPKASLALRRALGREKNRVVRQIIAAYLV